MMKVLYEVKEGHFQLEDGARYTAYGIAAYRADGGARLKLDEVDDISVEHAFVSSLTDKLNEMDMHIEHFRDAVLDAVDS